MTNNLIITKDVAGKKIHVVREFAAPLEKVWKAWTDSSLLDKWWAPKPWRAETQSMDFRPGGMWFYCMVGPDGTRHWCRVDYKTIVLQKKFTVDNGFADEKGNIDTSFPMMHWLTEFETTGMGSKVVVSITFDTVDDLQKIVAMGFEGGFSMGLQNLEDLLVNGLDF